MGLLSAREVSIAHLLPDLVTVIQWGVRPELIRWLGGRRNGRCSHPAESRFDPRIAAVFFERHSGLVDFHLRDALGQLQRYLEGLQ